MSAALGENALRRARDARDAYAANGSIATAVFLADKALSLSGDDAKDALALAELLRVDGQHRRALGVLRRVGECGGGRARLLRARCLFALKAYEECVMTLEGEDEGGAAAPGETEKRRCERLADGNARDAAAMCALRGRAYEALENTVKAFEAHSLALSFDPMCYEAYEAVLATHMLSEEEERVFVASLDGHEDDVWIRDVYVVMGNSREVDSELARGAGEETNATASTSAALELLKHNGDVRIACARRMYQRGEFAACCAELQRQFALEPSRLNGLPLYFATLVELGKKNDLYLLAHSLVDEYPKKAVTWFAIGCYYMATRQYDAARKYFSKATSIDASFVQAWIGYGHAFAAQDESDQAMAAYRTATRLFAGTHIPVMSIGMEYQRTNNLSLASQFFRKSFEICSTDPLLFNEYGVLLYRQGEYVSAVENFERALDLAPKPVTHRLESLVVNLAQALRKMGRHDEAIEQFQYALSVAPRNASTHAALAFTYQVKSRCTEPVSLGLAIEHYHKALSLRSDDAFSQHHLELALIDQSAITVPKHEKVDFETAFPIGDPIAATPEAPSPQGGLFPPPSPRSFRSTPTFGQTPFASAAVDESVDMDQSVDMDEGE